MLKSLKNNENGIIFISVLVTIIIMMVITVSIIGMNVSKISTSEKEVKRIQAETLAMGVLGYTFANQLTDTASNLISISESIDGHTFVISSNITSANLHIDIAY